MKTLKIQTVTGAQFEITGNVTQKEINGETIYYVNGQSFPEEIVKEII